MWRDKAKQVGVLAEREFELNVEGRKVPGVIWSEGEPESGKPIVGIRTSSHAFQKDDNETLDRSIRLNAITMSRKKQSRFAHRRANLRINNNQRV